MTQIQTRVFCSLACPRRRFITHNDYRPDSKYMLGSDPLPDCEDFVSFLHDS